MPKIPTKEEYLKALRNHQVYSTIIKKAPDDATRRQIISTVEYVANAMFDGIIPVLSTAASNPEAASQISEALKTGDNIIKESDGAPIAPKSKE